jgi:two-component system, cell cycle response regulator
MSNRVLTVDDSRAMRGIISKALASLDLEILQAEDGEQGLKMIAEHQPELVLLDITMPVMDGPTMLKELRGRGDKTRVILLTAESGTSIIGPLFPLGFDDYIVKPFKAEELCAKVAKILNPQPKAMPAPEPAPARAVEGGSFLPSEGRSFVEVLLIDDMENVAKQFRTFLPEIIRINNALDGQSAATLCRERLYRVVLVDLEIPDVDTASLVRQLRALQPTATFLALVMRNVKNPVQVAREKGLDGAVVKPFDVEQIKDFLATYFETKDLIEIQDNVLRIASFSGRKERELRYFARLSKLIDEAIDKLAAACYPQVILDVTHVPPQPDQLVRLLTSAARYTQDMGMELRLVGPGETRKIVQEVVETASIPLFESVAEAQSASGKGAEAAS